MKSRKFFQKVLQEIDQIDTQLHLKLPASKGTIQRQNQHILSIQRRLETIRDLLESSVYARLSLRHPSHGLIELVNDMLRDATSFQLLLDEFLVDPEGTVSCLKSMDRRRLLNYERKLKVTEAFYQFHQAS